MIQHHNKDIEICLGHIIKQNERCKKCIADEYNQFCEDYKPTQVIIIQPKYIQEDYSLSRKV